MANIVIASTANASMSDYPLILQATGGDPALSYTAADVRQLIDVAAREGVCGLTDFRVTQRGAGANLTVDFAAGKAIVQGDSVTRQGKFVADSTGTVNTVTNLTVPGAGTRIHHAILRIADKQAAGTTYGYTLEILEDTGTGKPALPASAISLAEISVAAGTGSITDAMITDTRSYALTHGVLAENTLTVSTASITWDNIPAGIKNLRIVYTARSTGGFPAIVLNMRINQQAANYFGNHNSVINNTNNPGSATGANGRVGVLAGGTAGAGKYTTGRIELGPWNSALTHNNLNAIYQSHFYDTPANSYMETGGVLCFFNGPYKRIDLTPDNGSFAAGSQFALIADA